jgi:hypothetical protein
VNFKSVNFWLSNFPPQIDSFAKDASGQSKGCQSLQATSQTQAEISKLAALP